MSVIVDLVVVDHFRKQFALIYAMRLPPRMTLTRIIRERKKNDRVQSTD